MGIEKRYEEMLVSMHHNIESVRTFFNERLDLVRKEFYEKIMNEKRQNLTNMQVLIAKLDRCMRTRNE